MKERRFYCERSKTCETAFSSRVPPLVLWIILLCCGHRKATLTRPTRLIAIHRFCTQQQNRLIRTRSNPAVFSLRAPGREQQRTFWVLGMQDAESWHLWEDAKFVGRGNKNLSDQQNIVGTPLSCRQENREVFRFTSLSKIKQIFLSLLKTDNPPSLDFH